MRSCRMSDILCKIFVFKMTGKEKYQPRIKSLEERLSFATYEQIKAYVETIPLKQRKLILFRIIRMPIKVLKSVM